MLNESAANKPGFSKKKETNPKQHNPAHTWKVRWEGPLRSLFFTLSYHLQWISRRHQSHRQHEMHKHANYPIIPNNQWNLIIGVPLRTSHAPCTERDMLVKSGASFLFPETMSRRPRCLAQWMMWRRRGWFLFLCVISPNKTARNVKKGLRLQRSTNLKGWKSVVIETFSTNSNQILRK